MDYKGWHPSTIRGAARAGSGLLNIDLYRGVKVWGRTKWIRSAVDSKRRNIVVQPEHEWIVQPMERLRIVPAALWERVKARQRTQSEAVGDRIRAGLTRSAAGRSGRRPQYLFSGLLRCGECGSRFVMGDSRAYACAGHVNGRGCTNQIRVRRDTVERCLKLAISKDLLSPPLVAEFRQRIAAAVAARKRQSAATTPGKRLAERRTQIGNLTDAVAFDALRASPAIAGRLRLAEDELAKLEATRPPRSEPKATDLIPRLMERYTSLAGWLENTDLDQMPTVRDGIREAVGPELPRYPSADRTHLEAHLGFVLPREKRQIVGLDTDAKMCGAPDMAAYIPSLVIPLR